MRRAASVFAIGLSLCAGCRHEPEGPTGTEVATTPAGTPAADAAVLPTPEVVDAAAPGVSVPPENASSGSTDTATAGPHVTPPDMSAAPAYPASALYATFSSSSARARLIGCYLPGKQRDPKLRGKVIVKFTINTNGMAKPVENNGSNLEDDAVIDCVVRAIKTMHFQKPVEGTVTVVYPFIFRPTGEETLILPDVGKK